VALTSEEPTCPLASVSSAQAKLGGAGPGGKQTIPSRCSNRERATRGRLAVPQRSNKGDAVAPAGGVQNEVLPGFEPGSLDSESRVLTITP
jgi:hypothetical protein